ncbi:MAG: hypothetical protein H6622_00425 [Halobacteriovoraceae bacterium]|nr:hypothetical protein [Halobacteriovoraceae bacterium]
MNILRWIIKASSYLSLSFPQLSLKIDYDLSFNHVYEIPTFVVVLFFSELMSKLHGQNNFRVTKQWPIKIH